MLTRKMLFLTILCALFFLAACRQVPEGESGGTATPEATRPPASSATPTPQPAAPVDPVGLRFVDIPEQIAPPGRTFNVLDAYAFMRYRDFDAGEMSWSVTSSEHIAVDVTDGIVSAVPLDPAWTGSETIQVEACEPTGACVTTGVVFTVLDEAAFSGVSVTYVGSSGFLITVGEKKVLIDAFFEGFSGGYVLPATVQDALVNAEPPFDGVDLILATHDHADHFTAWMVREHMQNNPQAVFISTSQAAGQLAEFGERVIAVDPAGGAPVQAEANGIRVEALYLSHGYPLNDPDEVFNNGYVVAVDGITFFHTGDIASLQSFREYDLEDREIDFAFIPHFYVNSSTSPGTIETTVGPTYLFPTHYQYSNEPINASAIQLYHPNAIIFHHELETWTMPLASAVPTPQPTATRADSGEYVEFTTEDDVRLVGTFYPAPGDTVVVFAHMGISDQTGWQGFAARLAEQGMPALTFDFRCYGLSACDRGSNNIYYTTRDIQAAIGYLRERGYERIVCAGASMGAEACMSIALREELAGLVFIAGPSSYPLDNLSYPDDLINPGMPKLFIVAEQDRYTQVITDTADLYALSPEPKQWITYPSDLHGTELFDSQYGEQFSQALLDFLLPLNGQP